LEGVSVRKIRFPELTPLTPPPSTSLKSAEVIQNFVGQAQRICNGKLEVAQQIANHESPRTTKLYDRRTDEISLDEIERIAI
jgi:hypothetical protein